MLPIFAIIRCHTHLHVYTIARAHAQLLIYNCSHQARSQAYARTPGRIHCWENLKKIVAQKCNKKWTLTRVRFNLSNWYAKSKQISRQIDLLSLVSYIFPSRTYASYAGIHCGTFVFDDVAGKYLQSTMTTKRMSVLGLLDIYPEREISAEQVVDVFARRNGTPTDTQGLSLS